MLDLLMHYSNQISINTSNDSVEQLIEIKQIDFCLMSGNMSRMDRVDYLIRQNNA